MSDGYNATVCSGCGRQRGHDEGCVTAQAYGSAVSFVGVDGGVSISVRKPVTPTKDDSAVFEDKGLYTLAFALQASLGGGPDWGEPVRISWPDNGAVIEYRLPTTNQPRSESAPQ